MRLKALISAVPAALTVSLSAMSLSAMLVSSLPVSAAPFVSQQQPPWCFRFPGDSTAKCNYYTLQECLIGARVIGGKCERYHAEPGQLTPVQQQQGAGPKVKKARQ